jgi:hypothetical protein
MKDIDFMNEPKSYIQEVTEYISVKRKERLENAIFGEIKEMVKDNEHFTTIELNEKAIVEALEKQMPQKVIVSGYITYCPRCKEVLETAESINYCTDCGQALKWDSLPTEKGGEG